MTRLFDEGKMASLSPLRSSQPARRKLVARRGYVFFVRRHWQLLGFPETKVLSRCFQTCLCVHHPQQLPSWIYIDDWFQLSMCVVIWSVRMRSKIMNTRWRCLYSWKICFDDGASDLCTYGMKTTSQNDRQEDAKGPLPTRNWYKGQPDFLSSTCDLNLKDISLHLSASHSSKRLVAKKEVNGHGL